jgi:3-phenylpropionate/cinnamic acid dioxygenase small subunit
MQTSDAPAATVSRLAVEDFLFTEADLLDHGLFEEWHRLFTDDGTYLIPLSDDGHDLSRYAAIVNDDPLRLEERVYHLSHVPFPSQSPRSRTLHLVTNVRVRPVSQGDSIVTVVSNQLICEMRLGDFRQVGLGDQRLFAAEMEHRLQVVGDGAFKISKKTVRLLNRGASISNLTFLL